MADKEPRNDYGDELKEVWSLFAEDGREALDLVEETLLALESNPTAAGLVAKLFRGLHTFKGNARIMGLDVIESLAHHGEDLVALVRDEGVTLTGAMVDLLLEVLDQSRAMLTHALAHHRDADAAQVEGLLARLEEVLAEHAEGTPPRAPSSPAPVSEDVDDSDEAIILETAEEAEEDELLFFEGIIDPATDPEYVLIFLEMAEDELRRLRAAIDGLAGGAEEHVEEIEAVVDTLVYAAAQMGYEHWVTKLHDLAAAVEELDGEARIARLRELELALSENMVALQPDREESVPPLLDEDDADADADLERLPILADASGLFRHGYAEGVLADLTRLIKVVDKLEQLVRQYLAGNGALAEDRTLADEAACLLQSVYQACIFYDLDQAARLTLALGDLYARIARGEMTVNEALLNLTRTCVARLNGVVEAIREGETLELAEFETMLNQIEGLLHLHNESRAFLVANDVLELLDLAEFREVMTPASLLKASRALQAGDRFYTVLADLNRDGEIGQAFGKWSRSDTVRLITSVTVYRNDRTLFNFLLATSEPREAMLEILAELDPEGCYLSLEECTLREGVDLDQFVSGRACRRIARPVEQVEGIQSGVGVATEALVGFVERVGELAATRATFHRVTQRLAEMDLLETVVRLAEQWNGDWRQFLNQLQPPLGLWEENLRTLSQIETEMGAALDRFQETALALRARPAAEILAPLKRLAQSVAQVQGKLVKLNLEGMDVRLDHAALGVLADPLRRLVWFAVAHGIEKPVQRRETDKPVVGRVSVVVSKTADRAQVVVEDDGRGLEQGIKPGQLGEIEGIDLAAIGAELQTHRGQLRVISEPGKGTRVSLELPLDMVVIDGMVIRAGNVNYVAPIEAIRRIIKPEKAQIVHTSADGDQYMLRLDAVQDLIPIQTLVENGKDIGSHQGLLVVVEKDGQSVALAVDELVGQQQVLIQPLQGYLADVERVSGYALLGESDVGMVLDLNRIIRATQT
jgi:two-component system, chemotaxis family, sensor kinase CheA